MITIMLIPNVVELSTMDLAGFTFSSKKRHGLRKFGEYEIFYFGSSSFPYFGSTPTPT